MELSPFVGVVAPSIAEYPPVCAVVEIAADAPLVAHGYQLPVSNPPFWIVAHSRSGTPKGDVL
jgi:hypothetical protein